jgi:hypothetical protein
MNGLALQATASHRYGKQQALIDIASACPPAPAAG